MTYLEAIKRIAHKVGFDEAESKEIVLALVEEHGTKAEIAAARAFANGPDATSKDAAFQKAVDAELARRESAVQSAANKASKKAAKKSGRAKTEAEAA